MQNSVVIFTQAAQMLAEADTLQKAKELKTMALSCGEWAKRKKMGEEAIQYCRSYALEAERKMGQMLKETERANDARDKKKAELHNVTPPPTLSELGLTKRESAEAQKLAELPGENFDQVKAGKVSKKAALAKARELTPEELAASAKRMEDEMRWFAKALEEDAMDEQRFAERRKEYAAALKVRDLLAAVSVEVGKAAKAGTWKDFPSVEASVATKAKKIAAQLRELSKPKPHTPHANHKKQATPVAA